MLRDLESLTGAAVNATDGEIGSVQDFLFDDQSWTVRFFVVNVSRWLERQDVVQAITTAEQADSVNRRFHVRLTKEQVRKT